jgi:hypothetical protein
VKTKNFFAELMQRPIYLLALQEHDVAIQELERACEERSSSVHMVGIAPEFVPLRSDRRFLSILNKIGLEPEKVFASAGNGSRTTRTVSL